MEDWSQLKQSSTACITCFSLCLILKGVCLIVISNVERGNKTLVLVRPHLCSFQRSEAEESECSLLTPAHHRGSSVLGVSKSSQEGEQLFPLSWVPVPRGSCCEEGPELPFLGHSWFQSAVQCEEWGNKGVKQCCRHQGQRRGRKEALEQTQRCSLWERPWWSRCFPWRTLQWSTYVQKEADTCAESMWSIFILKYTSLWERNMLEKGKTWGRRQGSVVLCLLYTTPIPHPLVLLRGHIEESGVKLTLGRRGGRGERSFWVCFCFSPSYTVINW